MLLLAVTKRWFGGWLPSMTAAKTWVGQLTWRECEIYKSQRYLRFWSVLLGLCWGPSDTGHGDKPGVANSWPGSQRKKEDNKVLPPPLKACPLAQAPHCTSPLEFYHLPRAHLWAWIVFKTQACAHTAGGVLLEDRSLCFQSSFMASLTPLFLYSTVLPVPLNSPVTLGAQAAVRLCFPGVEEEPERTWHPFPSPLTVLHTALTAWGKPDYHGFWLSLQNLLGSTCLSMINHQTREQRRSQSWDIETTVPKPEFFAFLF